MRFDAMMNLNKIHLEEVKSTNSWLLEALSSGQDALPEGTVVYTMRQTAGRGQVGNSWESEADKNLSFSLLLRPSFVPIPQQFVLSEVCCVGVLLGLQQLGVPSLTIKWPNDIYAGDDKLCGILIEHRLMGGVLSESVLGVGINVNQTRWIGNAPNPTSLKLQGIDTTPELVLDAVTRQLSSLYALLKDEPSGALAIHKLFVEHLYRRHGFYPYVDVQTGEPFSAELAGVEANGPIVLRTEDGSVRKYWFKEVRFALPCGVVKE